MREKYDIFFDAKNQVYQVRTKADVVVIEFSDEIKENIFKYILDLYEEQDFYSYSELKKELSKKYSDDKIIDVIKILAECSILNKNNFGKDNLSIDVNDGRTWISDSEVLLEDKKIGYIGEAEMGQKLKKSATQLDYSGFEILEADDNLDEQAIKNLIADSDFFIADITLWSPFHMEIISKTALKLDKPWLLIEGMIDKFSYSIGPIFHGRETGCYDCYTSRLRSNDEFRSYTNGYEKYLRKYEKFSKPEQALPLAKEYIAPVIILDISKFIGEWFIPETWRNILIFDTNSYEVTKKPFLKAPLCYTCKPELDYSPAPWFESVTLL